MWFNCHTQTLNDCLKTESNCKSIKIYKLMHSYYILDIKYKFFYSNLLRLKNKKFSQVILPWF